MNENKIQVKKIFGKYHNRLIVEAVIKTLIYCLTAGFAASFATVCVSRLARFDGAFLALMIGMAVFVFPAIFIYFKKLRPSAGRVASRIDRLGLEERVVTMLELDGESSFMAVKQREDAKGMLKRTSPKQLKIKIPVRYAAVLIIVATVSIYMMLLPPVQPAVADESAGYLEEELSIIEQMLADLRETIDEAEVNEELKIDLNELVDKLEAGFNENDAALDRIMKILETSDEIRRRLEEASALQETQEEQENIAELMEQLEDIMSEAVEMIAQEELSGMQASGEGESGQGEGEGEGQGQGEDGQGGEGEGEG